MNTENKFNEHQGHWMLAKLGKRVLRPGGRELTEKLIAGLKITPEDDIVEFAPGLGFTADISLSKNPNTYTGVELNHEVVEHLKDKLNGENIRFINTNAAASTLESESATKVYGEAMLTMHADHRKTEIIREAYRILKKGGVYAIHELGLTPNNINEEKKAEIQKDLAIAIKVNARPLTESEWTKLLEQEGFLVKKIITNPMHLLEPKRVIDDEGFFRTIKIIFNILTNSLARKRIFEMRKVFRKYQNNLNAICIIAEKR